MTEHLHIWYQERNSYGGRALYDQAGVLMSTTTYLLWYRDGIVYPDYELAVEGVASLVRECPTRYNFRILPDGEAPQP